MSPTMEFESKNVERALQKASEKLNIPADKIEHDVISYGSTGIFGLVGAKKARIRVVVPDETPETEPVRRPKKAKEVRDGVAAIVNETFGNAEGAQDMPGKPDAPDGSISTAREALQKMVDHITSDAVVSADWNGDKIRMNVVGGNSALLIGKRGQTLEAMQYLVDKILNHQSEQHLRVQVDIEGYLDSRRERLESLALRLGEKVRRTGKPATAGQFNAHDRRIIHLALKEDSELRTHSMGDGYYRKLKIFPKKKGRKRQKKD